MNGGLDAYLFFDLLFKNFSDVEFYMLGDCDSGIKKYSNVTYVDTIEALNGNEFDCGLIFAGVYNKDDRLCKYLTKKNKTKWYMFNHDYLTYLNDSISEIDASYNDKFDLNQV